MPDELPFYLTAPEVARMLRLSPKSIYRLSREDPTFPMLKVGGAVRFPRERLLRWLLRREQGPGRPRSAQRSAHGGAGAA